MREIKFRAWEKSSQQMHEVVQIDFKNWIAIPVPEQVDDEGGVNWILEQRRIADVELMQYTGLKDKNGKEVYEGDIMDFENGYITEIFWDRGGFRTHDLLVMSDLSHGIIIGNIYQNPNLLN
jgi:uncharacterized phage protein (TIGR01671 family)